MPIASDSSCLRGIDADATEESRRSRRRFALLLLIVLVPHLALRLWYASHGLHAGHFWDENVNVDNAKALLSSGKFAPANGFYPTLAYLPQVLAMGTLERTSGWLGRGDFKAFEGGRMQPHAYMAARTIAIAWSLGCLAATFALGARLFSPAVGFVGAILLAAAPWQVNSSATWKPDSLVTLLMLLVVLGALSLLREPDLRSHLLTGAAIGLAMSSKFTAAFTPLVVVTASLLAWKRARSPLLHLALAGLSSLVVFLFLNPQIALFFRDFGWTMMDYARHASWERTSRADVVLGALVFPGQEEAHGAVVGGLAALGLLAVAIALLFPARDGLQRSALGVFVSFPVLFVAAYGMGTPRLKPNNLVPLLPFSSLLAAVAICGAWEAARDRLPVLRARLAGPLALAALLLATAPRPLLFVYRGVTPTTEELAQKRMRTALAPRGARGGLRVVFLEREAKRGSDSRSRASSGTSRTAVIPVTRLADVEPERLDRADAEIFGADRLSGSDSAFYRSRLKSADGAREEHFRPSLFRARGPEIVAIWHPWLSSQVVARSKVPLGSGQLEVALARAGDERHLYSFVVQLPKRAQGAPAAVRMRDVSVPLRRSAVPVQGVGFLHLSERLFLPEADTGLLRLQLDCRVRSGEAAVSIESWRADGARGAP